MACIFDDPSVQLNGLLNKYIPVSAALSDEQIKPSIESAWEIYIVPLMGDTFSEELLAMAAKEEKTGAEENLLNFLRRAVANLAFWHNFTELNVHITDQGFQRQEGDTFKPLYRYQEVELKQQFKNKGFNALDKCLNYLIEYKDTFTSFKEAPAYLDYKKALVKGAAEIESFAHINYSYLIYLTMQPLFKKVMDTMVAPAIGAKATEFLESYLAGDYDSDSEKAVLGEKLRAKVAAVVILGALAMHVRNVGSITDRGVYYEQIEGNEKEILSETAAENSERARMEWQFQHESHSYLRKLLFFVENSMSDYYAGDPDDVLNRDNEKKHTFWA